MIISLMAFDMVLFFLFVAGVVIFFSIRAKLPSLRFALVFKLRVSVFILSITSNWK